MSKKYGSKTIHVYPNTKDLFVAATPKKDQKKITDDEFVKLLLNTYKGRNQTKEDSDRLEQLKIENTALKQQLQTLQQVPTQTSTTESQKEASTTENPLTINIEPKPALAGSEQCPYYSFNHKQELVHCSKDFDTKGAIHRIQQEVCDMCWDRIQSKKFEVKKDLEIAEGSPCLCRFDHDEEWLCALNAPTVRRLEYDLKTCQACPNRLTEELKKQREAQGEFTETKRYITCGAKEKQDAKAGIIVWDSKNPDCAHNGYAVPIEACFQAKCSYAKLVQVMPKK